MNASRIAREQLCEAFSTGTDEKIALTLSAIHQ
jgi:hypothetical protein